MKLHVPARDVLISKIPLFLHVNPLLRARAAYPRRGVYQPLANQQELLTALAAHAPVMVDEPCFVDIVINWQWHLKPSGKRKSPAHATKRREGDLDNLAKAINDALVKNKIIRDDQLIVGQSVTKAYGPEDLTTIAIWSALPVTEEVNPWNISSARISEKPLIEPFPILQAEGDV